MQEEAFFQLEIFRRSEKKIRKALSFSISSLINDVLPHFSQGAKHWQNFVALKMMGSNNIETFVQNPSLSKRMTPESLLAMSTLGFCDIASLKALIYLQAHYEKFFSQFILFTIHASDKHLVSPLAEWKQHTLCIARIKGSGAYAVFSPANYFLFTKDGATVENPDFMGIDVVEEDKLVEFLKQKYKGDWDAIDIDQLKGDIARIEATDIVPVEITDKGIVSEFSERQMTAYAETIGEIYEQRPEQVEKNVERIVEAMENH